MGKLTFIGRGQRGIDFYANRSSIWVGLGRTSPWPHEDVPPEEDTTAITVDEMFGMKLFEEASLVIEDSENGNILHEDKIYRRVTDAELDDTPTDLLYIKFVIDPDEFPDIDYRQIGVFVDPIPKEGFSSFAALTPDRFQKPGRLVFLDNFTKVTRYQNTRHEIIVVIPG